MTKHANAPYVYFSDGAVVADDDVVASAGFTEAPEARTSRIYLKFGEEWLAHEVEDDFIASIAHHNGVVFAVGRNGLVKTVGVRRTRLTPNRVRGKFRQFSIEAAQDRGHLERVRGVADQFYACGWGGQIYQLSATNHSSMENGLDPKRADDFLDIDGVSADNLYVGGLNGTLAHYDGSRWRYVDLPTNAHIYSIRCLSADDVLLVGAGGCLFRGNYRAWKDLSDPDIDANFWSVATFAGKIYVAYGDNGLYVYDQGAFTDVKIAEKNPLTHRLDASASALWSFGSQQLLRFDGSRWMESICPDNE